jgi:hypothetical protein
MHGTGGTSCAVDRINIVLGGTNTALGVVDISAGAGSDTGEGPGAEGGSVNEFSDPEENQRLPDEEQRPST